MSRAMPSWLATRWRILVVPVPLLCLAWFAQHIANVGLAGDSMVFYQARGEHLYLGRIGAPGYAYSPAFAQVIGPLQQLPFETFRAVIALAELLSLAYLIGPWLALGVVVFQVWPLWEDLLLGGNLQIFATATLVLALRHPTAWPAVFLLKVTPGIGLLWPILRGQWRHVAIGLELTVLIVLISFAYSPQHWVEWTNWMVGSIDTSGDRAAVPLWFRGLIAAAIIVWAARTNRIWWVPVAAALASPEGHGHWTLLLGALSLWLRATRESRGVDQVDGRRGLRQAASGGDLSGESAVLASHGEADTGTGSMGPAGER